MASHKVFGEGIDPICIQFNGRPSIKAWDKATGAQLLLWHGVVLGFALFSFFAFCFHSVIGNIGPFKIIDVAEEVPTAASFDSPAEMEQVLPKHP